MKKIEEAALVISIVCLIAFVYLFMNGWHNLDLSWNFRSLEKDLCFEKIYVDFSDTGIDGINRPLEDYWRNGSSAVIVAFFGAIFTSFILILLINRRLKK